MRNNLIVKLMRIKCSVLSHESCKVHYCFGGKEYCTLKNTMELFWIIEALDKLFEWKFPVLSCFFSRRIFIDFFVIFLYSPEKMILVLPVVSVSRLISILGKSFCWWFLLNGDSILEEWVFCSTVNAFWFLEFLVR